MDLEVIQYFLEHFVFCCGLLFLYFKILFSSVGRVFEAYFNLFCVKFYLSIESFNMLERISKVYILLSGVQL